MIPIKTIMTENVITVVPSTPIYEAMNLLAKYAISGVPVVDSDNKLIGILTEKDVLKILINPNIGVKDKVEDYMTKNVFSFTEDADAITVCEFLIKNPIRRVPIVRDGKLVGIVSRRDIIALILEAKEKLSDHRFS